MNHRKGFEFECEAFKSYLTGNIAVVKIKGRVFDIITRFSKSRKLFSIFKRIEEDPNIKALVVFNEKESLNETAYDFFMNRLLNMDGERHLLYTRHVNVLNRFIQQVLEFKKTVISGLQGNIATPFVGASLAADLRFASENMSFSFPHLKYDIHPGGALPFFLSRYLNPGKTMEILLKGEEITAKAAFNLGLVNDILAKDDFENFCVERAMQLSQIQMDVVKFSKQLTRFPKDELRQYFSYESKIGVYKI